MEFKFTNFNVEFRLTNMSMAKNKNTITISDILYTIDNFYNINNAAKKEARNKMVM